MAKQKKFYAVAAGRKTGIYTEWFGPKGAEVQVRGFSGAVFQGFPSREAAEAFLKTRAGGRARAAPKTPKRPSAESRVKAETKPANTDLSADAVTVFTDGGALGNPGPGGYGVVILGGQERRELSGGYRLTTNNRMELTACIEGLGALKKPSTVLLYSDSRYVVNGISKGWAKKWRANGWMRNKTQPAVNPDLWERLLNLCQKHEVSFHWVKGHAGHEWNERCDRLANAEAAKNGLPADEVYEASLKNE